MDIVSVTLRQPGAKSYDVYGVYPDRFEFISEPQRSGQLEAVAEEVVTDEIEDELSRIGI